MFKKNITQIKNKEFTFETLEIVLHSLHIVANKHKKMGDSDNGSKYFYEKEVIMKKFLDPIYIEEVGEKAFIIYDADKHRYRIPVECYGLDEISEFYEELPIINHTEFHKCGEPIIGCLEDKVLDEFYEMVIEGSYKFIAN